MTFAFDNTYARLPSRFYAPVSPTKVQAPRIVKFNRALAADLNLDADEASLADILSGNAIAPGAEPIALAYAGHQFGGFVRQLGDGRAILLGEVIAKDGRRFDIQLKGSGRTPFSRGGDGRATLGSVIREYSISEAMAALGIPTTRSLAVVLTGQPVVRENVLPGAILTRVAASHMRVGTFEFFAARDDRDAVSLLATYALQRHYPHAMGSGNDARALLECVVRAQSKLVASWLGIGFVHGVMNTDNMTISGETIDYGPCAFLDEYDPKKTFSSIDHGGRYAFANQPRIVQWNIARLAETLLPLIAEDENVAVLMATERIEQFTAIFDADYARVVRAKLGLAREQDDDASLMADLLSCMASNGVDYTVLFRMLCTAVEDPSEDTRIASLFADSSAFNAWSAAWRHRLEIDDVVEPAVRAAGMRRANPAFIPRNHRVEQAIEAAVQREDFEPFETLVRVLSTPYDDQPEFAYLADPPRPEERVRQTFCGT